MSFTDRDINDLFLVHALIAGELAARAADSLDDAAIARLRDMQIRLDVAADAAEVSRLNHEIHRVVNLASDSARLTALLKRTVQHVPLRFYRNVDGLFHISSLDHVAVFDAMQRRDRGAARAAMSLHIMHTSDLFLDYLHGRRARYAQSSADPDIELNIPVVG